MCSLSRKMMLHNTPTGAHTAVRKLGQGLKKCESGSKITRCLKLPNIPMIFNFFDKFSQSQTVDLRGVNALKLSYMIRYFLNNNYNDSQYTCKLIIFMLTVNKTVKSTNTKWILFIIERQIGKRSACKHFCHYIENSRAWHYLKTT